MLCLQSGTLQYLFPRAMSILISCFSSDRMSQGDSARNAENISNRLLQNRLIHGKIRYYIGCCFGKVVVYQEGSTQTSPAGNTGHGTQNTQSSENVAHRGREAGGISQMSYGVNSTQQGQDIPLESNGNEKSTPQSGSGGTTESCESYLAFEDVSQDRPGTTQLLPSAGRLLEPHIVEPPNPSSACPNTSDEPMTLPVHPDNANIVARQEIGPGSGNTQIEGQTGPQNNETRSTHVDGPQ